MHRNSNITGNPISNFHNAGILNFWRLENVDNQHCYAYKNALTFTGKEKDSETGFYYFGARYYDPSISGLFLSVDPMSDKYPSISPYAYCAWNPVRLVDPDGKDLYIPDKNSENHNASKKDILSLVNEKNRKYVLFDEYGKVSLSKDVTPQKLKMDKGLDLINDLVTSEKKFLYESTDDISSVFRDGNNHNIDELNNGVVNASNNGKDSDGGYTHKPKEGYDGHIILSKSGQWIDGKGRSLRRSLSFHEIAENYYRTHCGDNYKVAHKKACEREGFSFDHNPYPGSFYPAIGVQYIFNGQKAIW